MLFEQMHPTWQEWLADTHEFLGAIDARLAHETCTPEPANVLRALASDPKTVRVLLIGQDPYPKLGDAIGLSFAIEAGRNHPGSLRNIIKELESDLGLNVSGDLTRWVDSGVLLLNRHLTCAPGAAGSHRSWGWQNFSDRVVEELAKHQKFVSLEFGREAATIEPLLADAKSAGRVIEVRAAHPSPLSAHRGFLGSKVFSQTNAALKTLRLEPINWNC
jgi:uracil-DNA glycosylase